jgi:hypothetical protein
MVKRARRMVAMRLPQDLVDALHDTKARFNLAVTEQIEIALREWLTGGGPKKTASRRALTRRKA